MDISIVDRLPLKSWQFDHTKSIVQALATRKCCADTSDTGTGKTFTALAAARALGVVPLVICPLGTRAQWAEVSEIMGVPAEIIHYERAKGRRREVGKDKDGRPIRLSETQWFEEKKWGTGSFMELKKKFAMVVFDEGHRCGGATSMESKMLIGAKRRGSRVLIMSATLLESTLDMKAAGFALDLHKLSKKRDNFINWAMKHGCTPGVFGGLDWTEDEEKQKAAISKVKSALAGRLYRMDRSLIPEFPQTLIEPYLITADDANAQIVAGRLQHLNQMIDEYQEQADKAKKCENWLEESLRLRQSLELMKLGAIKDLSIDAMQNGSAVVIALNFSKSIDEMFDAMRGLDCSVGIYDGRCTADEKEDVKKRFTSDELDVIIIQAVAGAEGLNLQHPYVPREVFYSPGLSGKKAKQFFGRVWRVGGSFSRQRILALRGTAEEGYYKRLRTKLSGIDNFNDLTFSDSDFTV